MKPDATNIATELAPLEGGTIEIHSAERAVFKDAVIEFWATESRLYEITPLKVAF